MANRVQRNPFQEQPPSSEGSNSLAKKTQKAAKKALATPQTPSKRERSWTNQTDSSASPNTPSKRPNNSEAAPGTPTGSYHSPASAQSPRTPTAATVLVMPQLKGKRHGTFNTPENVEQSFGKELSPTKPSEFIQSLKKKKGIVGQSYQLPSSKIVDAIAQPTKGPTCGPGCALMIGLKNINKMVNNHEFWNWYAGTGLSKGECLLNAFKHIDIPARVCKMTRQQDAVNHTDLLKDPFERKILDEKKAVAFVEKTITKTGNPVILAIAHPTIKGHWIIVDGFDKNDAFIRDPYTGKAFALPKKTLSKWLLEKDPVQEMVYFP
jgi:hypothetical protein